MKTTCHCDTIGQADDWSFGQQAEMDGLLDVVGEDPEVWVQKDGTPIRIIAMGDRHLINTILLVERRYIERVSVGSMISMLAFAPDDAWNISMRSKTISSSKRSKTGARRSSCFMQRLSDGGSIGRLPSAARMIGRSLPISSTM